MKLKTKLTIISLIILLVVLAAIFIVTIIKKPKTQSRLTIRDDDDEIITINSQNHIKEEQKKLDEDNKKIQEQKENEMRKKLEKEIREKLAKEEKEKAAMLNVLNLFLKPEMEIRIVNISFNEDENTWKFEIEDEKNHTNEVVQPGDWLGQWSVKIPMWGHIGAIKRSTDIKNDLLDKNHIENFAIDQNKIDDICNILEKLIRDQSLSNDEMNNLKNNINFLNQPSSTKILTDLKQHITEPGIESVD